MENIGPIEFIERFSYDKHGNIFKENIYLSDIVYTTLAICLLKGVSTVTNSTTDIHNLNNSHITNTTNINTINTNTTNHTTNKNKKTKEGKEGKDKDTNQHNNTNNMLEFSNFVKIQDKIILIVELYNEDKLIYSQSGFNSITINNIILEGQPYIPIETDKKGKDKPKKSIVVAESLLQSHTNINHPKYLLKLRLDLTEIPQFLKVLIFNTLYPYLN